MKNTNTNRIHSNIALHNMLTRSLNSGHLCHAYLLVGQNGIGKKTIAKYFATGVLCKGENKPCFECSSCHKILSDNHPDLFINKSGEGKSSIHKDVTEFLRKDAYIMPIESRNKIYIIPNIENMSDKAFNSLLKLLEEPPENAMFILTAESKSSVSQTISSRCVSLTVYPLSDEECISALEEIFPEKPIELLKKTALQSNGILGKAIEILSGEGYLEIENKVNDIIDAILRIDEYSLLKTLTDIKKDKQLFLNIIDELLIYFKIIINQKLRKNLELDPAKQALSYKLTLGQATKMVGLFQQTAEHVHSNVNLSLLTSWFSSQIFSITI